MYAFFDPVNFSHWKRRENGDLFGPWETPEAALKAFELELGTSNFGLFGYILADVEDGLLLRRNYEVAHCCH